MPIISFKVCCFILLKASIGFVIMSSPLLACKGALLKRMLQSFNYIKENVHDLLDNLRLSLIGIKNNVY